MDVILEPPDGLVLDATATMYPSRLEVVRSARTLASTTSTFYGFAVSGHGRARSGSLDVALTPGVFFAMTGPVEIAIEGMVAVIERLGFRGLATAGAIEREGRLAYIDGCSDSVLVSPPRLGDPVLNFLHFPRGIEQTVHAHPSIRLGVVARGEGHGFGPTAGGTGWEAPLRPGGVFLLHAHEAHAFRTTASDRELDVIAFHPDSDWGPTDAVHPMANRTYLGHRAAR